MSALVAVFGAARPASAQAAPPAPWSPSEASVIVAAESLFGVYGARGTQETRDNSGTTTKTDFSTTELNLLSTESSDRILLVNPMTLPHVSIHLVVASGVTLGTAVGFAADSGEFEKTGEPRQDAPALSVFVVGPRLGYLLPASPGVSIWFRGGMSYYTMRLERQGPDYTLDFSREGVFLNLDPMLVISPFPHVGLLLGPALGIGVYGSVQEEQRGSIGNTTVKGDITWTQLSAVAGVSVLF